MLKGKEHYGRLTVLSEVTLLCETQSRCKYQGYLTLLAMPTLGKVLYTITPRNDLSHASKVRYYNFAFYLLPFPLSRFPHHCTYLVTNKPHRTVPKSLFVWLLARNAFVNTYQWIGPSDWIGMLARRAGQC